MSGVKKFNKKKTKILALVLIVAIFLGVAVWYLSRANIPVMEPAGQVGFRERKLMLIALLLAVIVVIPVFSFTIAIAVKYREGNSKKAKRYTPDWDHSRSFETLWWGIPTAIIAVLSVITWYSSHALDPYKALAAANKPITVQVVALDWKWLFIYPQQNIASVNMLEMPVNTPVSFQITSDTVMNSFWIPQLGGQIYAMPGMNTQLHLIANKTGTWNGSSANISGTGFASMTFKAKGVSGQVFNDWIESAKNSKNSLTQASYNQLAKPTIGHAVTYYSNVADGLYNSVIMKYMMPMGGTSSSAPTATNSNTNPVMTPGMQGMYTQ